ncbi:MAG TPA: hypothetical protein VJS43_18350 [Candidatus Acidoferrales bacterium]|nr:hypothetical protein [Candidatus Acidoferrales bacterium]
MGTVANHVTEFRHAGSRAEPGEDGPVLPQVGVFLHRYWRRISAISVALLIPCFWHRRIVSSDLGSHLYNAWLAQLIRRGQVTDMRVAHQWTNILFDYMLGAAGAFVSLHTAERIVVPVCVLVFFWGAFAMACAAAKRAPWFLTPFLALATYGWTFHLGLFNYYLSLGLAFLGIATFWRGRRWERALPLALVPLIVLAHPLGLLWLVAACAYVGIAEALPGPWQLTLFAAALGVAYAIRFYIVHHFGVQASLGSIVTYNGADQVVLFGARYNWLKIAVIVATLGMLAVDVFRRARRHASWKIYFIPLQLYFVIEFAVQMLPSGVTIANDLAAIAILTERLTSVAAVLGICVLAAMLPSRWHLVLTAAIASVFFAFVYQDTAVINRMEAQAEKLVRSLPRDSRVLATIFPLPDSRVLIQHMIDRACIGYCFSYGNYEPGTGLFQVRGDEDGPYNMGDYGEAVDMEEGHYKVQPQDLPAYQVYQCTQSGTELCLAPLNAGEENDAMGVYGRD